MTRNAILAATLLLVLSTTAAAEDAWYVVRPGDYLFRIARLTGTTVEALKRDNGLSGDIIHPDQRLRVARPFAPTRGEAIAWRHPCDTPAGETLRPFGEQRRGQLATRHTGLDLTYPRGGRVVAPAHGVVRYLGDQDGYGRLMIIEHGAGYATVLGPFAADAVYVETGRIVLRGDGLGLTGAPVEGNLPYLHVELRRDNEAVDPARLLR
ncbi:LysM peptidoglycan-binding domain-containing M23 family metallopeptidase [bacterium]|nr:LysM peptidoglycan-binding domain-containing M23 family metallopeptidase [bacterium]